MPNVLEAVQTVLTAQVTPASWAADNQARGLKVAKYRRYQAGEHDAQMTTEMRNALRISTTAQTGTTNTNASPFNSNQMDDVITTMTDRLTVDRLEADNDTATEWCAELLDFNRFDGLQMDVHEAALRDGDSYVLVEYDNDEQQPYFCHEQAWDGTSGMMVVHSASNKRGISAAVKVWLETQKEYADTLRVNIYYPNRIEKYTRVGDSALQHYEDPDKPGVWPQPWTMDGTADGEPIGVPVVQFRNRAQGQGGYGKSELSDAIPLQDALNRNLHSMVIAAELTAFGIYVAKGFTAPAALTPGMFINIEGPLSKDQVADMTKIDGSSLQQYIDMARFFIGRIEAVTRTPNMELSANLSGEAMKQSEIKLLGKVKRFQVTAGNAWEDVIALAHRVTLAFGVETPPPYTRWRTRWVDAQIRNDKDTVANAVAVKDIVGKKQTVENLSVVYGWDEAKQAQILADSASEQNQRVQTMLQNYNPYPANGANPLQMMTAPTNGNTPLKPALMQNAIIPATMPMSRT